MDQIDALEEAIISQANHIADQYNIQAKKAHEDILRESSEKLHLKEDKAVLLAKAESERVYRKLVQSNELKLRAELDHQCWEIVTGVDKKIVEEIKKIVANRISYLPILTKLIQQAVDALGVNEVVLAFNQDDYDLVSQNLQGIKDNVGNEVTITLEVSPEPSIGGVIARSRDNRHRYDNRFEGRLLRLQQRLHQEIQERLLHSSKEDLIKSEWT